jgi:hypothetical protein
MATSGPREVPAALAGELGELQGLEQDLEAAKQYCVRLQRELSDPASADWIAVQALSEAAIIRYARCFTTGSRERLTPESLELDAREDHDWSYNLRDKHIAHSVNECERWSVTVHVIEPPDPPAVQHVSMGSARWEGLPLELAERLQFLCDFFLEELRLRSERVRASVEETVLSRPIDEVYAWPVSNPFPPSTGLDVSRQRKWQRRRTPASTGRPASPAAR